MPDQIAESEVNMQVWVATKVAPCKGMTWWLGAGVERRERLLLPRLATGV